MRGNSWGAAPDGRHMHDPRLLPATTVLFRSVAFALGLASAWACGASSKDDACPQGSDGCACAFGFCDDGLACVAEVCMSMGASSETSGAESTAASSVTSDASTSTAADESSSSEDGVASSSSSGEPPSSDPFVTAMVDGVPSTFDIDPHAYLSPGGTLLVVGSESGGQGADLLLRIPPTGPGAHACVLEQIDVAIYYTVQGPAGPLELSTRTTGECTIVVEASGEVGELVTGTFAGEARFPGAMELPPVVITDGEFSVLRTPDE